MCALWAISSAEAVQLPALVMPPVPPDGEKSAGWGVAWYEQGDVHRVREAVSSGSTLRPLWLSDERCCARLFVGHLHQAGNEETLRNTQPFQRESGGVVHLFAHSGQLSRFIHNPKRFPVGHFRPLGETDSERAFCVLMARLAALWQDGRPDPDVRLAIVADFAARLRSLGPATFLYSDGELLFAHSDVRRQADQVVSEGLYQWQVNLGREADQGAPVGSLEGAMTMLTSAPADCLSWQPLPEGEVMMFRDGRLLDSCPRLTLWHEAMAALEE
ncbi:class II glutamine amidotransferase [Marinobacterium marinum]|uniref:Class II glutamine amidotransferase n=1 Tax=Marinobacterium marinum TaxID=2756129 RepID=A0A7W1WXV1_9GAMM|nr:class II glutamine amidotransferase [Marinobacterium marinum]MBA4502057.1 class II glutamine amidotransferase [Marinobacterium marinum]